MPPSVSQKHLPPFFQLAGPPPPISVLTTQIELALPPSVFPLLAELDLSLPKHSTVAPLAARSPCSVSHRTASYKKRSMRIHSPSPDGSSLSLSASDFGSSPEDPEDEPEDESDDQSDSQLDDQPSDDDDDNESNNQVFEADNGTIPKPPGEVGRPGRGGYNLKQALAWPDKEFKRFRVHLRSLVGSLADKSLGHCSPQDKGTLGPKEILWSATTNDPSYHMRDCEYSF